MLQYLCCIRESFNCYSPELDVQLSIARLFHGLGRTPEFCTRVKGLLQAIKKLLPRSENSPLAEQSQQLSEALGRLWKLLETVAQDTVEHIDWDGVSDVTRTAMEIARDCARTLSLLAEAQEKRADTKEKREVTNRLKNFASYHWRLSEALQELHEHAGSDEVRLSNLPALLLVAEAGRGKTHLFCDIAQHRMEEFLGALEAAAQAHRTRAIILIDALNEGQGKALWKKHLAGILLAVSKSPWLGIAISVRTSYEGTIVPEGLVPSRLIRAEHHGFAEHEYEATKTFFDHFGIQRPSIPLLVPEFQNPLFLKSSVRA